MIMFSKAQPNKPEDQWKVKLNQFAKKHSKELAALSWGLFLEKGESDETIGIDLKPRPHFVYCPKAALEKLNQKVENYLQEVVGIVNAHQPDKEVLMIGIGNDQIKLIHFEPESPPPVCFEEVGKDVDTLIEELEQLLSEFGIRP